MFLMNPIPSDMQAIRGIEDRAAFLGGERHDLTRGMVTNTQAMVELLRDAEDAGVPLERLASLLGVSRQTLYNWRDEERGARITEQCQVSNPNRGRCVLRAGHTVPHRFA
jgi:hypothetical protein